MPIYFPRSHYKMIRNLKMLKYIKYISLRTASRCRNMKELMYVIIGVSGSTCVGSYIDCKKADISNIKHGMLC